MSTTTLPAPAFAALPARDRFVDLVRLVAVALVVLQHWLMPVLRLDGDVLHTGNAFAAAWVWPVTWVGQVVPLLFFAGGAAAAMSLRATDVAAWVSRRLHRLTVPVLALAAVWLPLTPALTAFGLPAQPVHTAGRYVGALLWFLALYAVVTVSAPALVRLAARARGGEVAAAVVGAVLVDVARFTGAILEELAYVNDLLVWGAVHQVGVHYAAGRLWWLRGTWALAVAAGGFAVVAGAVLLGPYPASMIGLPGAEISPMGPPAAVLLPLAAGQLGLASALRPAALRWADHPTVGRLVDRLSGVVMTVYLWHTPALVVVAGTCLLGLGIGTPPPFSGTWYLGLPLWLAALGLVLAAAVRLLGRVERRPAAPARPHPARLAVAALLVPAGLLGLTVGGFAPGPPLGAGSPWVATLAVAAGVTLLADRPTIDRWLHLRSSTGPARRPVPSTHRAAAPTAARTGE